MTTEAQIPDVVSHKRLEEIRREAIAEAQVEIKEMERAARHLPKDGLQVRKEETVEAQEKRGFADYKAPVFEVVEDGGAVVAEHSSKGVADADAHNRTLEYGIPFRVRRKRG